LETLKLVLHTQKLKGYEIRREHHEVEGEDVIVDSAYTPNGDYIGSPQMASFLVVTKGIAPELASPERKVCTIGWSERTKLWYGWSHRSIMGFGEGYVVEEGEIIAMAAGSRFGPGDVAETLDDAKEMAKVFASVVG
jgi:hypothetical protein